MTTWTAVASSLRMDGLRVLRDRFLVGITAYLVAIAVAMRWVLPWLVDEVHARLAFDLTPYLPLMVSYFGAVVPALTAGLVTGFLWLEAKEQRTLHALRVSPLGMRRYLLGGAAVTAGLGALLAAGQSAIVGLGLPPVGALLGVAVVTGLCAPAYALFLAAASANKVEAFAQMKILSTAAMAPVGGWFLPEPWQTLAWAYPPLAACKAWWMAAAGEPGWVLPLAVGAAGALAVDALLLVAFERRA